MADAIPVNSEPQEKPAAKGKNKGASASVPEDVLADLKAQATEEVLAEMQHKNAAVAAPESPFKSPKGAPVGSHAATREDH